MSLDHYKVALADGKTIEGKITAKTEAEARKKVEAKGPVATWQLWDALPETQRHPSRPRHHHWWRKRPLRPPEKNRSP